MLIRPEDESGDGPLISGGPKKNGRQALVGACRLAWSREQHQLMVPLSTSVWRYCSPDSDQTLTRSHLSCC